MTVFHLSRDASVDAGYVYLAKIEIGEAARAETHGDDLVLDFDDKGRCLGIETLTVARHLGPRDPILRLRYDAEADRMVISFGELTQPIMRTEYTESGLVIGFDEKGRLTRVEVPEAHAQLRPELLEEAANQS